MTITAIRGFRHQAIANIIIILTANLLGAFIDEVISRTRLLRHYEGADLLKVDLVGHSTGGLLIGEYLSQFASRSKVSKVVTIASFKTAHAGLHQADWLAMLGAGQKTRLQLTVKQQCGGNTVNDLE